MSVAMRQSPLSPEQNQLNPILLRVEVTMSRIILTIARNNSATMSAAPGNRSGEAGALLNLMRVFGTSIGVAGASAVLSWRLEALTGVGNRTLTAPEEALLGAVNDGLLLLPAFAFLAGLTSVLRAPPRTPASKAVA